MKAAAVRAILILPGSVLILVPAVILWSTGWSWDSWEFNGVAAGDLVGVVLLFIGFDVVFLTIWPFARIGQGTLAPWQPPQRLVVTVLHCFCRNPMISGIFLFLLGEALMFRSWPLAAWATLFMVANLIYIPLIEEPGLERRFGADYRAYKQHVPRWIPRLKPWDGAAADSTQSRKP